MEIIDQSYIDDSISYHAYIAMIDRLFSKGQTTGPNQSEAYLNYTEMNIVRMRRLNKTIRLSPEIIHRLEAIKTPLHWLVITEAWCGDAAHAIPTFHKMASINDSIKLSLILRDEHPKLIDAFLTNTSRSIPKLICFDPSSRQVLGTWGPRPEELQTKVLCAKRVAAAIKDKTTKDEYLIEVGAEAQRWYAKDKTRSTQQEIMQLITRITHQLPV